MVTTFPELTIRPGTEHCLLCTRGGHSARDSQETYKDYASIYTLPFVISRACLLNRYRSDIGDALYEFN